MQNRRPTKFYLKAELFFSDEPDWELLAVGLRHFRKSQRGRIEFQHAQLQGNDYVLPFYFETHLETCKFEDRQRIDLDPEEAKEELYIELRENVEDFFGCHVEFTELIPDYLHPEDLRELEEAFARKERDFFAPRHSIEAEDLQPEKDSDTIGDPFVELDKLIGLEGVKQQIHDLAELVQKYGRENLPCLHMVFRGNPGTGKTTVARIIAQIFDDAGITSGEGTFVETDREGLVGMYVGHTAVKTKRVLKKAKGGTLFIDEAYALAAYEGGRDFGDEAIATLVKALEDDRDEFVCIMAGYPAEMDRLIATNPGLQDRIGFYIDFPDYEPAELCEVFSLFARENGLRVSKAAAEEIRRIMARIVAAKSPDFSNARLVRKIFERVRMDHLLKVGGKTIKVESIRRVFETNDMQKLIAGVNRSVGFCA